MRWHCSSDTGFDIRAMVVRGRARCHSSQRLPTILNIQEWAEKKHFVSFFVLFIYPLFTSYRSLTFQAGSFNHCTRAPIWRDTVWLPSSSETITKCWFNVGPPSATLVQQLANIHPVVLIVIFTRICSPSKHEELAQWLVNVGINPTLSQRILFAGVAVPGGSYPPFKNWVAHC